MPASRMRTVVGKVGMPETKIFKLTLRGDFKGIKMAGIHIIINCSF
jgi:hypothetical protein